MAAVLLTLAAACGSGSSGSSGASSNGKATITFAWWGNTSRATATVAALKLFEKAHSNVTVDTEYTPFGSYEQKISTQAAGGDLPDLITIDRGVQNEYAQRGMLLDLAPYVGKSLQLSGLNSAFVASGQTGGKQYAVPMAQNSQAIVVDETRVQSLGLPMPEAGWTWSQWQSWAQQVTTKSHGKYYGLVDPGTLWPGFQSWEIQHGTSLYSNGKINFTVADLTAWWNMCAQLRTSGAATNAQLTATVDGLPDDEPLLKGHAVAEWDYDSLFTMYTAGTTDKLTLVSLPTVNGKTGMFAQPSMMLGVSANSAHAAQAVELLDFLINSPTAATTLGTSRGLFPNLQVRQSMANGATGTVQAVYSYESANQGNLAPTPPAPPKGDGQLLTLMQTTYQKVAFGQLTPTAAAQQFYSQAQGIIGQ
ncbi:MAG TPA: extracellular solute-binding protein [Streptosporangiaceae bacterium]